MHQRLDGSVTRSSTSAGTRRHRGGDVQHGNQDLRLLLAGMIAMANAQGQRRGDESGVSLELRRCGPVFRRCQAPASWQYLDALAGKVGSEGTSTSFSPGEMPTGPQRGSLVSRQREGAELRDSLAVENIRTGQ